MRKLLAVAALTLTVAGCTAGEPEVPVPPLVHDQSIPDVKLVNDALRIDFDRRNGAPESNQLVPATRPPRLLRMMAGGGNNADGSVVMNYQFGEQWLHALVELSPRPTSTCEDVTADKVGLCVRDDVVTTSAGRVHVTVYFTGNVNTEPKVGDPETDEAAAFWSETAMVPLAEATWLTDLLVRGRAVAKQ